MVFEDKEKEKGGCGSGKWVVQPAKGW